MAAIELVILALMTVAVLMGGYYQLQILFNSKEGAVSSVWRGAWIFHQELLKEDGLLYRKKLFICLGVFFTLMLIMFALHNNK